MPTTIFVDSLSWVFASGNLFGIYLQAVERIHGCAEEVNRSYKRLAFRALYSQVMLFAGSLEQTVVSNVSFFINRVTQSKEHPT
jgi:hypothetical protein